MSYGMVDRFMEESTGEQKEERTKRDTELWVEKNNRKLAMEIQEHKAFREGYMAGMKDGLDVAKDRL